MSLKDGFTENVLSTEKGSAGLDMVLFSFMMLVFLAVPLLMGLFEVYGYVMEGMVWSSATENVLDQVEWQLQTEALSECERSLLLEETRQTFESTYNDLVGERKGESWTIQSLTYVEKEPPSLEVKVKVQYEPYTMIGMYISQGSKLTINLERVREFPIDR